jgi:hypothetical protein
MLKNQKNENKVKMPSFTYKYVCETCNYYTDLKNSYNKHIKTSKHLSLSLNSLKNEESKKVNTEDNTPMLENFREKNDLNNTDTDTELNIVHNVDVSFDNLIHSINEIKNDECCKECNDKLNKINFLMDNLNLKMNIDDDVEVKYVYFGMGFLFHFLLFCFIHLMVKDQAL